MDDQPTWQVGIWLSGYWSLPIFPCCIPGSLTRSHGCPSAAFIIDTVAVFLVGEVLLNMVMLFGSVVSCGLYVMLVFYSLAAVADADYCWATLVAPGKPFLCAVGVFYSTRVSRVHALNLGVT